MKIKSVISGVSESLKFASSSIRSNPLRTFLSLAGITVGVFCIIGIFTFVDSIKIGVEKSINKLGSNTLYIQKWPWIFSNDYPWWKYINRRQISFKDLEVLRKNIPEAGAIAYSISIGGKKVETDINSAENIDITGYSDQYDKIKDFDIAFGRMPTEAELAKGSPSIVIGSTLAENLFTSPESAIGKVVKSMGRKLFVVGVLKKEGNGMGLDQNQDMIVFAPVNFIRSLGNIDQDGYNPTIYIKGVQKDKLAQIFEDNVRGKLRLVRKLRPRDEDDFAVNKITMITSVMEDFFKQINTFGWGIAGFSILVGGFGIANIMFVSVKERTNIIGIQKALGAPNYVILIQFLGEAIFLCVLGGLVGLFLIFVIAGLITLQGTMELYLTFNNIAIGVGLSTIIGVISGFVPSYQASKMDPIEAIRSGI